MNLVQILESCENPALVIGNGINRHNTTAGQGWDAMLLKLWDKYAIMKMKIVPEGIALTEFYDALELNSTLAAKDLQKEFCHLMADWHPADHHKAIVDWAERTATPILTTNFDQTLSDCLESGKEIQHLDSQRFTDYYPWSSCFSNEVVATPSTEFAIWHINGIQKYSRSIRLGLCHYMGSVQRARERLHTGSGRLFASKDTGKWRGANTWLDIVFHNDLIIFGLELEIQEVFLRWLLLERAKYYKMFPKRFRKGFYVYAGGKIRHGHKVFLQNVGLKVIKVSSYNDIYDSVAWVPK